MKGEDDFSLSVGFARSEGIYENEAAVHGLSLFGLADYLSNISRLMRAPSGGVDGFVSVDTLEILNIYHWLVFVLTRQ